MWNVFEQLLIQVKGKVWKVFVNLLLGGAWPVDNGWRMRSLEYPIVVKLDDVSTIFDRILHVFIQFLARDSKHKNKWCLNTVQQNLWEMGYVDLFELEGEDKSFDSLATVNQLDRILACEQIACVE